MEIVYADVYRAVRARLVLREFGVGSTLVSGVGPGDDPDEPAVNRVGIADEDAARAVEILGRLDLMGDDGD